MTDLRAYATAWMHEDPDPVTRAQIEAMLDDETELARWFAGRLQFGTAGLRGPIGPGPLGLNSANIRRVTAGLGRHLLEVGASGPVVVGYDGRVNSDVFARDTARVLGGLGFVVHLFDTVIPTPRLAHAVIQLDACAGVMVTASHNPPGDNGYKVYWANGAQIIPPVDACIAAAISAIDSLADIAMPDLDTLRASELLSPVPIWVATDYERQVLSLRVHPGAARGLGRIIYTAMHGVGTATLTHILDVAGHTVIPVAEQAQPDGAFPTVAFPNPEEPGALDMAIALADRLDADLILANDPDADRLAVAVPDPDAPGGWRALTGNQVGCMLAEDLLTHGLHGDRLVATTLVSSSLLSRIAAAHGVEYAETLTGFKWIANRAIPFDANGGRFVVGYEEALGYSVGSVVRDKDGISAALLFADLAGHWALQGQSVTDALASLGRRYGVYGSHQVAMKHEGAAGRAKIDGLMAHLRQTGLEDVCGLAVVRQTDVLTGVVHDRLTGETSASPLPSSNVLAWTLEDGSRVLARPSGTEPKIKFYFESSVPLTEDGVLVEAERKVEAHLHRLAEDLMSRLP